MRQDRGKPINNAQRICLSHFHMVFMPDKAEDLSRWLQWLMTSHVRRYHWYHGNSGYGHDVVESCTLGPDAGDKELLEIASDSLIQSQRVISETL
jgi:hypothetical protein